MYDNYRLFRYNSTDLILQNVINTNSYVKLSKTDYTKGSLANLYSPNTNKVSGTWYFKPEIPNSVDRESIYTLFCSFLYKFEKLKTKIIIFLKVIDKLYSKITAAWTLKSDKNHFFLNNHTKIVWHEYRGNQMIQTYTLFKYNGTDVILKNLPFNGSYLKLTKTDYSRGASVESLYDSKVEKYSGFWHIEPIFTNCKNINRVIIIKILLIQNFILQSIKRREKC